MNTFDWGAGKIKHLCAAFCIKLRSPEFEHAILPHPPFFYFKVTCLCPLEAPKLLVLFITCSFLMPFDDYNTRRKITSFKTMACDLRERHTVVQFSSYSTRLNQDIDCNSTKWLSEWLITSASDVLSVAWWLVTMCLGNFQVVQTDLLSQIIGICLRWRTRPWSML